MRDFQSWNNEPVHSAPPEVNRVWAENRRRDRRNQLLSVGLMLVGAALTLWWMIPKIWR